MSLMGRFLGVIRGRGARIAPHTDGADGGDKPAELIDTAGRGDEGQIARIREAGMAINKRDDFGQSALLMACRNGHLEVVKALLADGADPDIQSENGSTALIWAAAKGYGEIAQVLLESGANKELADDQGWTAARFAEEQNYTQIAQMIASFGGTDHPSDAADGQRIDARFPPSTGDPFIDSCFEIDFPVEREGREWTSMPDVVSLAPIHNEDLAAGEYMSRLSRKIETLPDFDLLYFWLAGVYMEQANYDRASSVLRDGLDKAKAKHALCTRMGDIHLSKSSLADAVRWWIRSCSIQLQGSVLDDYNPFLDLSIVCDQLGSSEDSVWLLQMADRIDTRRLRRVGGRLDTLQNIVADQGTREMSAAIRLLRGHFDKST